MIMKVEKIPVLPLRDVVVYPNMVVPLFVGRDKSIKSLEDAMNDNNKTILLVTQKSPDIDDPTESELYQVGCLASILQLLKLPDGTMKVLVEGLSRAKIFDVTDYNSSLTASYEIIDKKKSISSTHEDALSRALEDTFSQYVKMNKKFLQGTFFDCRN